MHVVIMVILSMYQVGLMEEEKVLASVEESARETGSRIDGAMKKTRFYLAQDQESIGRYSSDTAKYMSDILQ